MSRVASRCRKAIGHSLRPVFALVIALLPMQLVAHSVGQRQTTKYMAPETVQMLIDRAGNPSETPGLRAGDIVSYIIQFSPVANGATYGVAGYVTDYIPPNTEVVGASIVVPSGSGFVNVAPSLPGTIDNGWGGGQSKFFGPFATSAFDPTGMCANAGFTNNCNGSLAQLHADTGIFFSTDSRTAVFPAVPTRIAQGTNGYFVTPTGEGQLNDIVGNPGTATTHNLWDAAMTNAFGSKNLPGSSPNSTQPILSDTGRSGAPFGAGSPVAGPQTGFPLDYTAATGPWQRIAYPGSRIGSTASGPAVDGDSTFDAPSVSEPQTIKGSPTSLGHVLSPSNPLPSSTNAVRWAVGGLLVGENKYVRISLRLLATPPVDRADQRLRGLGRRRRGQRQRQGQPVALPRAERRRQQLQSLRVEVDRVRVLGSQPACRATVPRCPPTRRSATGSPT